MFSNIGRKIKILAMAVFWFGLAVAAILVVYALYNTTSIGTGILTVLPAVVWIVLAVVMGSFTLYGFGELAERAKSIHEKMGSGAEE